MARAVRTRHELEVEILNARAALILIEDNPTTDELSIREARARVDHALDLWAQRR